MTKNISFEQQTQAFSTWGDKLLQHADVLNGIQNLKTFNPITIQLAPTEACDSDCPFCSVQNRPISQKIPFADISNGLAEFAYLGAKSVEITGGGNPLLYRDGDKRIQDVITLSNSLGLDVGVITNSEDIPKRITNPDTVKWVRVSMIKLDEGKSPSDYNFDGFDGKIGLSYIIHPGTTKKTIQSLARVVELWPSIKFVRIAADCLTEDSVSISNKWGGVIAEIDKHGKMFIKEIGSNFKPFSGGCWVGMIRPYWVSSGVYICTSHVLINRTYHPTWRLCSSDEILKTWKEMNLRFKNGEHPYKIDISKECWHCYYANNNKILSSVINELPDKNFA